MEDSTVPEDHDHSLRQRIGFILGPVVLVGLLLFPIPGLSQECQRLSAVLALAIIWWVTEAIPMAATAMLAPALCIPLGIAKPKEAFAAFASPIIFLFIGSFILAEAMRRHRLDQRLALRLLTLPGITRSPLTLWAALGGLTAMLSMWMSNAATTAVMLPIAIGILQACPQLRDHSRAKSDIALLIAYSASVGGLGTPVGTPPNLIALSYLRNIAGIDVTFLDWMKAGVPLVIVMTTFVIWMLRPRGIVFADRAAMDQELAAQRAALGPLTRGEINTSIVFLLAISLWMFPGAVELVTGGKTPTAQWMSVYLPEETVGILCGLMVFLLPVNFRTGTYTLTWKEAVHIDWGTIFLFAGGLALGTMIFDTGLAKTMGAGMSSWLGTPGLWMLTAAGVVFSLVLSEATSNTATANVMVPIFVAMAAASSLPAEPLALAVSLASSFGFMLPVSTGPNALAYGTGLIPLPRMIRTGFWLDIAGAIAIWTIIRLLYN